ncbi:hypothetical protein G6653_04690 [Polynucleobacter paneuropaeus]|nr:hypothetical protein [Polynucleobacter paneuropaeus]MBT8611235.1 hypothetical protein [Polynucleobacter paneuropaeus]
MNTPAIALRDQTLPNGVIYLQCALFAILNGIWILPETILVRHICLIVGALISLYVIYQNRSAMFSPQALPLGLLLLLFLWVVTRLFTLSTDYQAQWYEFSTIWKRTAIGFIFAIGFGMSLAQQAMTENSAEGSGAVQRSWWIVYAGIALPTLIYLVKYCAFYSYTNWGVQIPDFLKLYNDQQQARYFVHKSSYVFFCLPLLAISIARITQAVLQDKLMSVATLIYSISIVAVFLNFYSLVDRNGMLYGFILILMAVGEIMLNTLRSKTISKRNVLIVLMILAIPCYLAIHQYRTNHHWNSLASDVRIALDVDRYDLWKDPDNERPTNEFGKPVFGSNYERLAWAVVAIRLIEERPLGYGLVERSFGRLAREKWPESKVQQCHSGWLDWTLGMGIPGLILLLGAGLLAWHQSKKAPQPWQDLSRWGLGILLLMYCTTELSSKVYIDALIFMITLVTSMNIAARAFPVIQKKVTQSK